jgi:hypothetical protein
VFYGSRHVAPFFETITEETAIKINPENILKDQAFKIISHAGN